MSIDLYSKCIKEGSIEWTKPEQAQTAKSNWTKSKLRCILLSAGALIEVVSTSNKPLWSCFAPSIREIRSTTPLETPEDDNSFVIRTSDKEVLFR